MSGHGEKLTRKQEEAIAALISRPTVTAAAETAGVGVAILRRWLKEDGFKDEYRLARKEAVSHAVVRVQTAANKAVETLENVMTDTSSPVPSRVSAAKIILELSLRAVEIEDVEERLKTVEGMIALIETGARFVPDPVKSGKR